METFTAQVMADLEQGELFRPSFLDLRNNGGGSDGVIIPLLMELAPWSAAGSWSCGGWWGRPPSPPPASTPWRSGRWAAGWPVSPPAAAWTTSAPPAPSPSPNTEVRVSMSTKFIDTGTLLECAAGLGVEPIQPDVTVYQTLEDYLAGQDTLVDALCARTEPFQPQERPDAPLSRGRLTELLRQAAEQAGLDTQAPMQSLSDLLPCAWYAPGVCWALSSGVASGTGEAMFQASRPVTRQEELPWSGRPPGSWGWPLRHRRADGRRLHRLLGAGCRPMGGIRWRPGHSKRRLSSPGYPDPGGGGEALLSLSPDPGPLVSPLPLPEQHRVSGLRLEGGLVQILQLLQVPRPNTRPDPPRRRRGGGSPSRVWCPERCRC